MNRIYICVYSHQNIILIQIHEFSSIAQKKKKKKKQNSSYAYGIFSSFFHSFSSRRFILSTYIFVFSNGSITVCSFLCLFLLLLLFSDSVTQRILWIIFLFLIFASNFVLSHLLFSKLCNSLYLFMHCSLSHIHTHTQSGVLPFRSVCKRFLSPSSCQSHFMALMFSCVVAVTKDTHSVNILCILYFALSQMLWKNISQSFCHHLKF